MAVENETLELVRNWIFLPILGVLGIAWRLNEKEHDAMRQVQKELKDSQDGLKTNTSAGYSVLNDKFMDYVDARVTEVKHEGNERINKANDHIAKLYENAERDRAAFREALAEHASASNARHIELLNGQSALLNAIHVGLAGKADK